MMFYQIIKIIISKELPYYGSTVLVSAYPDITRNVPWFLELIEKRLRQQIQQGRPFLLCIQVSIH